MLFLGTFEIPKDFMRKSGKLYYGESRAFRFPEKLELKGKYYILWEMQQGNFNIKDEEENGYKEKVF